MPKIVLKGITWGHSRGITPLLAASQRFNELHPDVEVIWKKRTLQEFADQPIENLIRQYDLLIIDHPWVGFAADARCVLPLDRYLSKEYLANQAEYSVGQSHESYNVNGHQWALAIDAATPAASYRADLLQKNEVPVPTTWEEVLRLARMGRVAAPAIPIDLLMNFYMFCLAHGREPFQDTQEVIDTPTGVRVLETMREFYSLLPKEMFRYNPIAVAEAMSTGDKYWYCPFAYGYSNYAREGYASKLLTYTDLVSFGKTGLLRSTIGGTGIAVSVYSQHAKLAVQYAEKVVSPSFQSTFYVQHGGQPGHLQAWQNEAANQLTNNFFHAVLPTMQRGYMRPRYNGYLHFQDHAGDPLQAYLQYGGNPEVVLEQINDMYVNSFSHNKLFKLSL
ncbi:carbohydrate ABC transporter substrate-binding protein, CUT1 family [Filimonas lacunae]|uniref:Carbohydrate ABC transporter substrate-binding protein, CUT1 family n=1 Tax=Filimonas lacunae TaxID=477680 RepID=A0A173MCB4_9BACT|nr:extracellular solute-binding protein [Filimonas lacunae]BAV05150.1 integral membrane protein, Rhomboid family [Filimonas lacunae]SIT34149.1 carbohydrate ABC transporter substrate-binding protein, CUT1 family [Filimonas lacunae]